MDDYDPADQWVNGKYEPGGRVAVSIPVGMPYKVKLLMVLWLRKTYQLSHDDAIRAADNLEKFLEQNQ